METFDGKGDEITKEAMNNIIVAQKRRCHHKR